MTKKLLGIVLLLLSANTTAGTVLIHTYTTHLIGSNFEKFTPGISYRTESSTQIGYFKNSYKVNSFYAANIVRINKRVNFGYGLVLGYALKKGEIIGDENSVLPLIAFDFVVGRNTVITATMNAFTLSFTF